MGTAGKASLGFLALAASAAASRAQDQLWEAACGNSSGGMGDQVSVVSDMNGDGVRDVSAWIPWHPGGGISRILDGATGATLLDFKWPLGSVRLTPYADVDGDGTLDLFAYAYPNVHVVSGQTLATIYALPLKWGAPDAVPGDVDGDGIAECVASEAPGVTLHSGADGTVLRTIAPPPGSGLSFGNSGVAIGDRDGDGSPDLAVIDETPPYGNGPIVIVSLLDGSVIAGGGPPLQLYSTPKLHAVGDLDQDGVVDLALSDRYATSTSGKRFVGCVHLVSGATLAEFAAVRGAAYNDLLRLSSVLGDVDGDGFSDFTVATGDLWLPRPLQLFSGRTIRRLGDFHDPDQIELIDAPGHDIDGDGLVDVVVGRPGARHGTTNSGFVSIERGRTAFLSVLPRVKHVDPPGPWWGGGLTPGSTASTSFVFRLAGFQPASTATFFLTEDGGLPVVPPLLLGSQLVNGLGELHFIQRLDPPSRPWFYGVQASGTDRNGVAVTTATERFGYD